jgi:hypothetical protein
MKLRLLQLFFFLPEPTNFCLKTDIYLPPCGALIFLQYLIATCKINVNSEGKGI